MYKQPETAVQTNRVISYYLMLGRGTHQEVGLSLASRALVEVMRRNFSLSGVKISDCAETDVMSGLTINQFSKVSGYKVNWNKSEALPLTAFCINCSAYCLYTSICGARRNFIVQYRVNKI